MALYNKFVVYASKIKVTGFAPDSETLDTVVGVAVRDGTSNNNYFRRIHGTD